MQVERYARAREVCFPKLEEALLKNDAEDFLAEELLGLVVGQSSGQRVPGFDELEFGGVGDRWELEKVEGPFHSVDGEHA